MISPSTRPGLRAGAWLCALLLGGTGVARAGPFAEVLRVPLACRFQTVALGQFHGLDYGPGVPSGTASIVIAASADDLRQDRAALVEQGTAGAARVLDTGRQALLVSVDANDTTTMLTVFTAAGSNGAYPAALTRRTLIGSTPVLVESAGLCQPQGTQP